MDPSRRPRSKAPRALGLALLALGCGAGPEPLGTPDVVVRWDRGGRHAIQVGDAVLGTLAPLVAGWRLIGPGGTAELRVREAPLEDGQAYPRRVVRTTVGAGGARFEDAYTLLAPAAPLPVEGYGLVVSDDAPGVNDAEHEMLRQWLTDQGLPADTGPFERLHEAATGRELRVWYEISGRRVDGTFAAADASGPATTLDSGFRSEGGAIKIHHKRPGENGRFTYHRQSLERAEWIEAPGADALVAHECGCYGYAIAADFTTLGDRLFTVEADWLDDRVGAEFFVGLERRAGFPWIGLGERRRMRDLARRARAWTLRDAHGVPFAELTLTLPDDPPRGALGDIDYRFDRIEREGQRSPLAYVRVTPDVVELAFHDTDLDPGLGALDRWLAAMPVQVVRGDGLRDSQLGAIELLVDAVRLLRAPSVERLADFASEVDAASAAAKVEALLAPGAERFVASASARPPDPIPGPRRRALAEVDARTAR